MPAAFRRLCVETILENRLSNASSQPPSGGCVLKLVSGPLPCFLQASRLRAAVC